jgi:hypothetical protein
MVTCDGAGASHELVKELNRLASRHGYQVTWSVGWTLSGREQAAIGKVPESAWEAAIDAKGQVREHRADEACENPRCAFRLLDRGGARRRADRAAAGGTRR